MLNTSGLTLTSSLTATNSGAGGGNSLIFFMLMLVAIIFLFIMPARRQRKVQAQLKERQDSMGPGTKVMTNFGLFGTVAEVNQDENYAILEISPGSQVKVHLQTVTTVLDSEESEQPQEIEAETVTESDRVAEKNVEEYRYRPEDKGH